MRRPFEALRKFAYYWLDVGSQTQCCRLSARDVVASDPEAFNCETCTVMAELDALDPPNEQAWSVFQRAVSRFSMELHLAGDVIRRLTADLSVDEYEDVVLRLSVLFEIFFPQRKRGKRGT